MKALRKKYGKRPWIDTPNAAWYRRRCNAARFLRSAMVGSTAAVAYQNIQQIRSSPTIPKHQKAAFIAQCVKGQANCINSICERIPMPDPNKP